MLKRVKFMSDSSQQSASDFNKVVPRLSVLLGRSLLYLILITVAAGFIWASLTRVNVVVTADGSLVPRAESLRLSVPQGGIISAVLVNVGDSVQTGQPIMEIDSYRETADAAHAGHDIEEARTELARYRRSATDLRAAVDNLNEELASAQQVSSLLNEESSALREGYRGGAVSLFEVQAKEREAAESTGKVAEIKSELARSLNERQEDEKEALETEEKIKGLEVELARNVEAKQKTVVVAPVAGAVTYINSLRPGRYLAANDIAATLYPNDEPLMAEVWIPNESIRRVRPSLIVSMKLKAYPFQQFGLLPGRVVSVDPDVNEAGAYRAWIKPLRLTLDGAHGPEKMRTGLVLTAEIVVDRRSILDVLLDPLRRLRRGARSIAE
jgi:hemolysin D